MRTFEFTYTYIFFVLEKYEIKQIVKTTNKEISPERLFEKYIVATKGIHEACGYKLIGYREI